MTNKLVICIAMVSFLLTLVGERCIGEEKPKTLFYAPLDGTVEAAFARGSAKGKFPHHGGFTGKLRFVEGIKNMAIAPTGKRWSFSYTLDKNIRRERGSIGLWYYMPKAVLAKPAPSYSIFTIGGREGATLFYKHSMSGPRVLTLFGLAADPGMKKRGTEYEDIALPFEGDRWTFIVFTWEKLKNSPNDAVKIYFDGKLVKSFMDMGLAGHFGDIVFGGCPGGRYDEITIYKEILAPHQIKSIYLSSARFVLSQSVIIPKRETPIKVDGKIESGEWADCATAGGLVRRGESVLAEPYGSISACYDDKNLYLAFETGIPAAALKNIEANFLQGLLARSVTGRDADMAADDTVEITIVPEYPDGERFVFITNGLGAKTDYSVSAGGSRRNTRKNLNYNALWKTASSVDMDGWHVEISIPLAALSKTAPEVGDTWGINFTRRWRRLKKDVDIWQPGTFDRNASKSMPLPLGKIVFGDSENINFRLESIGDLNKEIIDIRAIIANTYRSNKKIKVFLADDAGKLKREKALNIAAGGAEKIRFSEKILDADASELTLIGRDADSGKVYFSSEFPFIIEQRLQIETWHYPSRNLYRARMDLRTLKADVPLEAMSGEIKFIKAATASAAPSLAKKFTKFKSYVREELFDITSLPVGKYNVLITLSAGKRGSLSREFLFEKKRPPEWLGNKLGISDKVAAPFTPIETDAKSLGCWGRKYILGNSIFPEQVITRGTSILAAPMKLVIVDGDGKTWSTEGKSAKTEWKMKKDVRVEYASSIREGRFQVRSDNRFEYDGFLWMTLRVKDLRKSKDAINGMYLEIPYKGEYATLMNNCGYNTGNMGLIPPAGFRSGNTPFWLGDERGGMQWLAETDGTWNVEDRRKELEVIKKNGNVLFRVHFINKATRLTEDFVASFGIIATPVRPMTPDYRRINSRNPKVAIAYGAWYHGKWMSQEPDDLADPWRKTFHAKLLDKDKVGPMSWDSEYIAYGPYANYSGTNATNDAFKYWQDEWAVSPFSKYIADPTKTAKESMVPIFPAPSFCDYFVWNYHALHKRTPFKSLYYDDGPTDTANYVMGKGVKKDGTVVESRDYLGTREVVKRTYVMLRELEGDTYIIHHHSGQFVAPIFSFVDYFADGENFTGQLTVKEPDYHKVYRVDSFRAQSMGHNFGPAVWFLDEFTRSGAMPVPNTPEGMNAWLKLKFQPVDHLFGLILLHDSTYWMAYAPWEAYERWVKALRAVDWGDRYEMIPYWNQKVVSLPANMYATFYVDKEGGRALMIFLNNNETGGNLALDIKWSELGIGTPASLKVSNPVQKDRAEIKDGKLDFHYDRANSRFFVIEAR